MEEGGRWSPLLNDAVITGQIPFFCGECNLHIFWGSCNLSISEIYDVWISFKVIRGEAGMGEAAHETEVARS